MDRLRTPFLIVAALLALLVVLIEIGSAAFLGAGGDGSLPTPGFGIPYLALFDSILLFTVTLFVLAVLLPARVLGATQGIVSFVFFLLLLLGAVAAIILAVVLLTLMVSLFLAVPFGTIAYMVAYADFSAGPARATLAVLMACKLGFAVFLVLAQQQFLAVKGLVLLVLCSLLTNIIVSFLHELVPDFLISITDMAAAIVVGIIAAVWALIKLVGSIPGAIKGLRLDRHLA